MQAESISTVLDRAARRRAARHNGTPSPTQSSAPIEVKLAEGVTYRFGMHDTPDNPDQQAHHILAKLGLDVACLGKNECAICGKMREVDPDDKFRRNLHHQKRKVTTRVVAMIHATRPPQRDVPTGIPVILIGPEGLLDEIDDRLEELQDMIEQDSESGFGQDLEKVSFTVDIVQDRVLVRLYPTTADLPRLPEDWPALREWKVPAPPTPAEIEAFSAAIEKAVGNKGNGSEE